MESNFFNGNNCYITAMTDCFDIWRGSNHIETSKNGNIVWVPDSNGKGHFDLSVKNGDLKPNRADTDKIEQYALDSQDCIAKGFSYYYYDTIDVKLISQKITQISGDFRNEINQLINKITDGQLTDESLEIADKLNLLYRTTNAFCHSLSEMSKGQLHETDKNELEDANKTIKSKINVSIESVFKTVIEKTSRDFESKISDLIIMVNLGTISNEEALKIVNELCQETDLFCQKLSVRINNEPKGEILNRVNDTLSQFIKCQKKNALNAIVKSLFLNINLSALQELHELIIPLYLYLGKNFNAVIENINLLSQNSVIDLHVLINTLKAIVAEISVIGDDTQNIHSPIIKKVRNCYTYSCTASHLEIGIKDGDKLVLMDLITNKKKEINVTQKQPLLQQTILKATEAANPIFEIPKDFHPELQFNEKQKNYLLQLFSIIDYDNIIKLEKEFNNDKFINTILKIGKFFQKKKNTSVPHYEDEDTDHLAFAVKENTALIVDRIIAKGHSKIVSAAYMLNTKQLVAYFKIGGLKHVYETKNEVNLIEKLSHKNPYLIPPFEWVDDTNDSLDMLQFCYDGTASKLSSADPWKQHLAFYEMALGIAVLHDQGYIHADVKPDNFLIKGKADKDAPFIVKVADLGLSVPNTESIFSGTPLYCAPEMLEKRKISERIVTSKIDSFSLGLSFFEILSCDKPRACVNDLCNHPLAENYHTLHKTKFGNLFFIPFGASKQEEVDKRIRLLKNKINRENLFAHEKAVRIKMVDVCASLLAIDENQRISCHEAAKQLQAISFC